MPCDIDSRPTCTQCGIRCAFCDGTAGPPGNLRMAQESDDLNANFSEICAHSVMNHGANQHSHWWNCRDCGTRLFTFYRKTGELIEGQNNGKNNDKKNKVTNVQDNVHSEVKDNANNPVKDNDISDVKGNKGSTQGTEASSGASSGSACTAAATTSTTGAVGLVAPTQRQLQYCWYLCKKIGLTADEIQMIFASDDFRTKSEASATIGALKAQLTLQGLVDASGTATTTGSVM